VRIVQKRSERDVIAVLIVRASQRDYARRWSLVELFA
jgi:hypothetical protein